MRLLAAVLRVLLNMWNMVAVVDSPAAQIFRPVELGPISLYDSGFNYYDCTGSTRTVSYLRTCCIEL